jgi:hypothetical protein
MNARNSAIDNLVRKILEDVRKAGQTELRAWKTPRRDFERLAQFDYVRAMRKTLGFHELRALIREAKRVWPTINHGQLIMATPDQFGEIASEQKIKLQAAPFSGQEGMALRGFYVDKLTRDLKQPLIYINTAHHPGAVAATFCHEMGHHVMARAMHLRDDNVHFFFDAQYHEHLSDRLELAADAVVSLAAYPAPLARKIFKAPWNWGLVARADRLPEQAVALVHRHMKKLVGIDFGGSLPPGQRIHYLSGMIHYAKLRWALMAEYEI